MYYNYVDIFTQALLMVTCLFFSETARDNKGIIMVIRTVKVGKFHFISKSKLTAVTIMMTIEVLALP